MFWKKDKSADAIRKAVHDLASLKANADGATRRATSMIPVAANGGTREVAHTASLRFHQLLISLEGNQRTGCLRIVSPKRRSRSAILIYRGRVLGCLFGCKKADIQSLQEDAHKEALADLASPGNILDAYELPEELVLASASLFNGEVLDTNYGNEPISCFEHAFRTLASTQRPGCIVVSTGADEMVCMVYLFEGKIIGVFSAKDGWLSPVIESTQRYLKAGAVLKIAASFLPIADRKQAMNLGFSLTGLADLANRKFVKQQIQAVDSFSTIRGQTSTYAKIAPIYNQSGSMPAVRPRTPAPVRSTNVFAIAPFA
jgi:hypothetical protein